MAIICKSLEIPLVVGCIHATEQIHDHDLVLIDGENGTVTVSPDMAALETYEVLADRLRNKKQQLKAYLHSETLTRDGRLSGERGGFLLNWDE